MTLLKATDIHLDRLLCLPVRARTAGEKTEFRARLDKAKSGGTAAGICAAPCESSCLFTVSFVGTQIHSGQTTHESLQKNRPANPVRGCWRALRRCCRPCRREFFHRMGDGWPHQVKIPRYRGTPGGLGRGNHPSGGHCRPSPVISVERGASWVTIHHDRGCW